MKDGKRKAWCTRYYIRGTHLSRVDSPNAQKFFLKNESNNKGTKKNVYYTPSFELWQQVT